VGTTFYFLYPITHSIYTLQNFVPHGFSKKLINLFCCVADNFFLVFFLSFFLSFFSVLRFELRALSWLGRCSTTWAIPPALVWSFIPIIQIFLVLQSRVPKCFHFHIPDIICIWNYPHCTIGRLVNAENLELSIRKISHWEEKQISLSNNKDLFLLSIICYITGGLEEIQFLSIFLKIASDLEVCFGLHHGTLLPCPSSHKPILLPVYLLEGPSSSLSF
jgi:hypothetical protein